jgi:hypothetical protein
MASDIRKKHDHFDTATYKDKEHTDAIHSAPIPPTLLPPLTPVKAAQFLGLNPEPKASETLKQAWSLDDGLVDDPVVRPGLRAQKSMPLLTRIKLGTDKIKFKEEGSETDSPKLKKDVGGGSHKAKRMFDFLPTFGTSKRAAANQDAGIDHSRSTSEEEDITDSGYRSDYEHHAAHRALPMSPHDIQQTPSRRRRKKDAKIFERMSPITETSFDDLRSLRDNGDDHDTELEVISEYEDNTSQFSPEILPRSAKKLPKSLAKFKLDDTDLSPTVEYTEDEAVQTNPYAMHPGTKIDPRKLHPRQTAVVPTQSPLQAFEARLLDECEENLAKLNNMEAERLARDKEVAKMKRDHEDFKESFNVLKQHFDGNHDKCNEKDCSHKHLPEPEQTTDAEDSDGSEGLVSLRSSIDLDEEPTVHVARAMTITRVTPGMVKLVDIPPRKNKGAPSVGGENKPPAVVERNTAPPIGFNRNKATLAHARKNIALPINSKNKPLSMNTKNRADLVNVKNKAHPYTSFGKSNVPSSINADTNKASSSVQVGRNIVPPSISVSQYGKKQTNFDRDGDNGTGSTDARGENVAVGTVFLEITFTSLTEIAKC